MTKEEALAMDLALEALEMVVVDVKTTPTAYEAHRQAITAIKQARSASVQEPVAYVVTTEVHGQMCSFIHRTDLTKLLPDGAKLYTTPPAAQRQWVGLTAGERDALFTKHYQWDDYGKAIEAKLKEKNNG